ncbi:MAG TPA: tryptophan synthase subunit alpha [Candidatus Syntrophoarchaeum butanivorans]|nr:MAG: tryptophan synthase subunit alpha [Candidatus Syntrophoarchaeum sp. WYZ-LMO15]HDM36918.1 tryptophan synthase subunit alpha [Candidatus Syntrophoarchaeum butanivorans]HEC56494.1 tryptophan synthase subunit alpha [Candidatus Syntrophoarchaeum butanivorans]
MSIREVFEGCRGRGALIGYLTCGDPDLETSLRIIKEAAEEVDILELGIPFSDPIADGATIQAASDRALRSGIRVDDCFRIAAEVEGPPKVFMTYYNIVLQRGLDRFFSDSVDAGVSGLIVPDIPIEESQDLLRSSKEYGVDLIFLVAPTTDENRMNRIIEHTRGFLYVVSRLGVTGARDHLDPGTIEFIRRVKAIAGGRVPVAVGFGISTPQHVEEVIRAGADGAIVGSAIIDRISEGVEDEKGIRRLREFLRSLREAARRR